MHELQTHLAALEATVRAAGAAAMRRYGRVTSELKADRSVVTEADHVANELILRCLRSRFPDDAILSEESPDSSERVSARRVWLVDPLDGTKEFLSQNGEFAVMVGLVEAGTPILGVVHLPASGVTYSAVKGGGAWVERDGVRLRVALEHDPERPLRLVGSRSHSDPLLSTMCEALGVADILPCGSVGVKCAKIVDGTRDLYIHPVPYLSEWDTCAPEIIVREAGGEVTDCLGERLRYNKPVPRQEHGIVACAPDRIEGVLAVIRPLYASSLAAA